MALENLLTLLKNLIIFSSYMTEKSSFPKPLSKEKEQEYLVLSAKGDKDAKEILVKHNLRLVAHIAKKYAQLRRQRRTYINRFYRAYKSR